MREGARRLWGESLGRRVPPRLAPRLALTLVGIILGTHHEKGAFTFWSYAIGLPLPSSSILSWKFCHVLHKVLRDGHPNVSSCCLLALRGPRPLFWPPRASQAWCSRARESSVPLR